LQSGGGRGYNRVSIEDGETVADEMINNIDETVDFSTMFMSASSDVIFKIFFGDEKNKSFLVKLLKSVLDLPLDEYEDIQITDPHVKREYPGDKLSILDVKAKTKAGTIVHIEIQMYLPDTKVMEKRIVFYDAKLITEQLNSGDEYEKIHRLRSIIIMGERFFENHDLYHDEFFMYSPKTGTKLTDLIEVHTLEIPKLPAESDGTELWDWLEFIKADSKEELAMLAQNSPQMQGAVNKLLEINQDSHARRLFEAREKERRDIVARERKAVRSKQIEIAQTALGMKLPISDIVKLTGLTAKDIEALR
jgi:predicted transposase/invertase (TIGR01784 family)